MLCKTYPVQSSIFISNKNHSGLKPHISADAKQQGSINDCSPCGNCIFFFEWHCLGISGLSQNAMVNR